MNEERKIDVHGVCFDNVTMGEALDEACALIMERRSAYVVTPNPEIVMMCRKDPEAAEAVKDAALTLPDGIGVIYASRILKTPLKEKVGGCDFSLLLMERLAQRAGSVFLLGAKPGVAEAARDRLSARFPGLRVVGTHDGYFTDDAPILAEINAQKPDLLLVCLGAPKQEKWMRRNASALNTGLMIGAGGSLDVYAGTVKRAPKLMCDLGLEWLYRLYREPRRIGRMMVLPKFLLEVIFKPEKREK